MSKNYNSRHFIQLLEADGWYKVRVAGSHHQFRHIEKPGIVTVPHPKKEPGKTQRINITMDRALLDALDIAATNQHKTRSALLSEAAQKLLGEL